MQVTESSTTDSKDSVLVETVPIAAELPNQYSETTLSTESITTTTQKFSELSTSGQSESPTQYSVSTATVSVTSTPIVTTEIDSTSIREEETTTVSIIENKSNIMNTVEDITTEVISTIQNEFATLPTLEETATEVLSTIQNEFATSTTLEETTTEVLSTIQNEASSSTTQVETLSQNVLTIEDDPSISTTQAEITTKSESISDYPLTLERVSVTPTSFATTAIYSIWTAEGEFNAQGHTTIENESTITRGIPTSQHGSTTPTPQEEQEKTSTNSVSTMQSPITSLPLDTTIAIEPTTFSELTEISTTSTESTVNLWTAITTTTKAILETSMDNTLREEAIEGATSTASVHDETTQSDNLQPTVVCFNSGETTTMGSDATEFNLSNLTTLTVTEFSTESSTTDSSEDRSVTSLNYNIQNTLPYELVVDNSVEEAKTIETSTIEAERSDDFADSNSITVEDTLMKPMTFTYDTDVMPTLD
ncbi:PREDICTED: mucin-17-like [Rhagoletis zephyria]|uniref:mucin-17-like n=1 Tax=Rhagoletis zephyria TaxID=28612 RepID=UPI0008118516|nr:PREDICTED: mucin-17-like [Rhagoletis zephyria]